ncbi:21 kDa protein [Morus notabilis]|uniref:21 kDa protein n=1 Tax=Morus notabilis TaxID=981085 RepID=W9QR39_9ROSA|nr:pectinesterase inhibitor 3 [Morus notabilis]EXB38187.1 21 kDa protein [Morus notabilis]
MSPLFLFILLLALFPPPYTAAVHKHKSHDNQAPASDLVRTSCVHANYPTLCLRTLAAYSGPARTPRDLAKAAVNVSLARASRVSEYLNRMAADLASSGSSSKRQRAALSDCVEQIGDSVEELKKTLKELEHLRAETFRWQMSNAETWVSAALTNEDTCLDGFQGVDGGGKIKADVRRKITNIAKVTSNALYMINRLDQSSRPRRTP